MRHGISQELYDIIISFIVNISIGETILTNLMNYSSKYLTLNHMKKK